jgi:hypothetical protein
VRIVAQRLEREIHRQIARLGMHPKPYARRRVEQDSHHERGIGPARASDSKDSEREE